MRPLKIREDRLLARLADLFRKKGYDGTSYADVMNATGLVKASLYYRFPGGKADMVNALLSQVDREFSDYVLGPAFEPGPPLPRAKKIARRIRAFYQSGTRWCLLDTLTLAGNRMTLTLAGRSMQSWLNAFALLSRQAGLPRSAAARRAEEAVAAIEGALILSRVLRNPRPFLRTLSHLPLQLTRKSPGNAKAK